MVGLTAELAGEVFAPRQGQGRRQPRGVERVQEVVDFGVVRPGPCQQIAERGEAPSLVADQRPLRPHVEEDALGRVDVEQAVAQLGVVHRGRCGECDAPDARVGPLLVSVEVVKQGKRDHTGPPRMRAHARPSDFGDDGRVRAPAPAAPPVRRSHALDPPGHSRTRARRPACSRTLRRLRSCSVLPAITDGHTPPPPPSGRRSAHPGHGSGNRGLRAGRWRAGARVAGEAAPRLAGGRVGEAPG